MDVYYYYYYRHYSHHYYHVVDDDDSDDDGIYFCYFCGISIRFNFEEGDNIDNNDNVVLISYNRIRIDDIGLIYTIRCRLYLNKIYSSTKYRF